MCWKPEDEKLDKSYIVGRRPAGERINEWWDWIESENLFSDLDNPNPNPSPNKCWIGDSVNGGRMVHEERGWHGPAVWLEPRIRKLRYQGSVWFAMHQTFDAAARCTFWIRARLTMPKLCDSIEYSVLESGRKLPGHFELFHCFFSFYTFFFLEKKNLHTTRWSRNWRFGPLFYRVDQMEP